VAKDDIDRIVERIHALELQLSSVKAKINIATWFLAAAAGAWIYEMIGKFAKLAI
jgi:hypothetical protein